MLSLKNSVEIHHFINQYSFYMHLFLNTLEIHDANLI